MESNPKRFAHWIQRNFDLANVLTGQDSKKIEWNKIKLPRPRVWVIFLPCMLSIIRPAVFGLGFGLAKFVFVMFSSIHETDKFLFVWWNFRILKSYFYRIGCGGEYWSIYLCHYNSIIESSICWTRMCHSTPTNNQSPVAFNQMLEHYAHVKPPHFVLYKI